MKAIFWAGSSHADLCRFPVAVRREAGFQLHKLQAGEEPLNWKPMKTVGSGVREIRIQVGGAYRMIYLAKRDEAIYVLHVFEKKTQKTRQKDIELAQARLREINATRKRK